MCASAMSLLPPLVGRRDKASWRQADTLFYRIPRMVARYVPSYVSSILVAT